eukprot:2796045-Amphidinium_carterae.1
MWLLHGKVPSSYIENATDNRHGYYSFDTEVPYAINDYMNLLLVSLQLPRRTTTARLEGEEQRDKLVCTQGLGLLDKQFQIKTGMHARTWTNSSRLKENELDEKDNGGQS